MDMYPGDIDADRGLGRTQTGPEELGNAKAKL